MTLPAKITGTSLPGKFLLEQPPLNFEVAVPNDSADIQQPKSVFIGGAGNLAIQGVNGVGVTLLGLVAGQALKIRPTRIMLTGTTATNIILFY